MKRVLIIIDMQVEFEASNDERTLKAIKREIVRSMGRGEWIFFVEFENRGDTQPFLTDLVATYDKITYLIKNQNDGSDEIINELDYLNIPDKTPLYICGINTQFCVAETVEGMRYNLNENPITVICDGCHTNDPYYAYTDPLEMMGEIDNTRFIFHDRWKPPQ